MRIDYATTSGVLRFVRSTTFRSEGPEVVEHPVPIPPPGDGWRVADTAVGPREGDEQRVVWTWHRRNPEDFKLALKRFSDIRMGRG